MNQPFQIIEQKDIIKLRAILMNEDFKSEFQLITSGLQLNKVILIHFRKKNGQVPA